MREGGCSAAALRCWSLFVLTVGRLDVAVGLCERRVASEVGRTNAVCNIKQLSRSGGLSWPR